MSDIPKLVHFVIVDGTKDETKALGDALKVIKDKLPYSVEFLITNDKVQLRDLNTLIKELYSLYKKYRKLKMKGVKK